MGDYTDDDTDHDSGDQRTPDEAEMIAEMVARFRAAPSLGEALRRERLRQQMSRKEVARAAGLSANYIWRIERDLRTPKRDPLIGITLAALGMPLEASSYLLMMAGHSPYSQLTHWC